MKIGLVRRGFSRTGGAEAYLLRFADAAREAGHECVLFGSVEWSAAPWRGKKIILPGGTPREFAEALRREQPRRECELLYSLERVWECDAYRAGDGVHAEWLAQRAKFEPWWRALFRRVQAKHRELLALERALFTGGAGRIIANSALIRAQIIARFHTPSERIQVVHNGVPPWSAEPGLREAARAELALGKGEFAVLFAGSGWERKGLRFALEAVRGLPGCTLLVAGEGRRRRLPVCENARFLGAQNREEMHRLLAAADAFVLPTIYEPFSNACLEARAAGLPVLTTSANGFAEILTPGVDGEITAPGDIPALRAALASWQARPRPAPAPAKSMEENVAETLRALGA